MLLLSLLGFLDSTLTAQDVALVSHRWVASNALIASRLSSSVDHYRQSSVPIFALILPPSLALYSRFNSRHKVLRQICLQEDERFNDSQLESEPRAHHQYIKLLNICWADPLSHPQLLYSHTRSLSLFAWRPLLGKIIEYLEVAIYRTTDFLSTKQHLKEWYSSTDKKRDDPSHSSCCTCTGQWVDSLALLRLFI